MIERLNTVHKQAAAAYAGLGTLVILITFLADLVPESRSRATLELTIGAAFILLFAVLIYRGWWPISAALVFSNLWRVFTYFNDGRGLHVEFLPPSVTPIEAQPVAFINAVLMTVIVVMLARSGIAGFGEWRVQRTA